LNNTTEDIDQWHAGYGTKVTICQQKQSNKKNSPRTYTNDQGNDELVVIGSQFAAKQCLKEVFTIFLPVTLN
jgi:hypothetical protein